MEQIFLHSSFIKGTHVILPTKYLELKHDKCNKSEPGTPWNVEYLGSQVSEAGG